MTTHCAHCFKLQPVCAIMETVNRRDHGVKARAMLSCGHIGNFITTQLQLDVFRQTKRLISERPER